MISAAPDEALELPLDELALRVLADMQVQNTWNTHNYLLTYTTHEPYRFNVAAQKAVAEAVAWLQAHSMIAMKPGDSSSHSIIITRRGVEAASQSVEAIRSIERLQGNLHPLIEKTARRQFLLGEYENAIFASMRAVEVRVRKLGGFKASDMGVDLMTKAFRGPLADPGAPPGEVDGTMMFFRSAYAVLRNPSGHREVSFDDVTEASEAVMVASLLMRMLDKVEARMASVTP